MKETKRRKNKRGSEEGGKDIKKRSKRNQARREGGREVTDRCMDR